MNKLINKNRKAITQARVPLFNLQFVFMFLPTIPNDSVSFLPEKQILQLIATQQAALRDLFKPQNPTK